jgi:hypothetical protein
MSNGNVPDAPQAAKGLAARSRVMPTKCFLDLAAKSPHKKLRWNPTPHLPLPLPCTSVEDHPAIE